MIRDWWRCRRECGITDIAVYRCWRKRCRGKR